MPCVKTRNRALLYVAIAVTSHLMSGLKPEMFDTSSLTRSQMIYAWVMLGIGMVASVAATLRAFIDGTASDQDRKEEAVTRAREEALPEFLSRMEGHLSNAEEGREP